LAKRGISPVRAVVTYGAPKVGGPEFKAAYEAADLGLKQRTLRIEAADDLVALISRHSDDAHVGHAWCFKKRPLRPTWQMILFAPLVDAEHATKKKVERLEARRRKHNARGKRAKRPAHDNDSRRRHNEPRQIQSGTWSQWIVELALRLTWYIARSTVRSLAAHSVEHRYGLYLSTLSYRKIRAYHLDHADLTLISRRGQENQRIIYEVAFRLAGDDLTGHLGVIRGRHPRTFRYLRRRPIRIETPAALARLEKTFENYVA